ncbi:MAG: hypothetical protein GY714_10490 [Desulfobacterales bacterium]|nr:hypothetical protein [Desulfobacterales bacterium]
MEIAKEMYQEARNKGLTFSSLLALERPSSLEGLDAFEFALYEKDINLKTSTVESFYQTKENSVLLPEFINRNVRIGIVGLGAKDLTLEDLVATETVIDSGVYETIKAEFDKKQLDFKKIGERAKFPTVKMDTGKNSIKLAKIGIAFNASYEVLRRMKLPLLAIHMQLIGKRLAKAMVAYAVHVLINGDGNANAAVKTESPIDYDNLMDWMLDMDNWEATVWFAKKTLIKEIFRLPEFKDSRLFDTAKTGTLATPFGYDMKKFNWDETTLCDDQIVQVDKSASLELVKENGAELIETDKIINGQFEETVISKIFGFSKIFTEAALVYGKKAA